MKTLRRFLNRVWFNRRFYQKQKLAKPSRYYGDGGTIHHTTAVNVELFKGKVVAVWFRCQILPFTQHETGRDRAREMGEAYILDRMPKITGVEVLDQE